MEIRVYRKHFFTTERVGTLEYAISSVAGQTEASIGKAHVVPGCDDTRMLIVLIHVEFVPRQFTAVLSFPTSEAVG